MNSDTIEILKRTLTEIAAVDPLLEIIIQMNTTNKHERSGSSNTVHVYLREMAETSAESTRFRATIRVLKILFSQLEEGKESTLRDIYYKDVSLFKGKQYNLNNILDSIASSFGLLLQNDFKVFPTPKGVIWSNKRIEIISGARKKLILDPIDEPILISHRKDLEKMSISEAVEGIIVFEKEAILKSFISYVRYSATGKTFLFITGKGFPDRATLSFLNGLNGSLPDTPLLFFVDSDVYGLQIFHSYIHGNKSLSKVAKLGGAYIAEERSEWLTIGKREWVRSVKFAERNLKHLLSTPSKPKDKTFRLMQREIQRGLILFKKAEMNVIKDDAHSAQSINHYLWSKIPTCRD